MVLRNRPESVALFLALSSCSAPLILLPPDLRPWRSAPPLPAGTRVALLEWQRDLAADAREVGVDVTVLADVGQPAASSSGPGFMNTPGLVLFTSGSTGSHDPSTGAPPDSSPWPATSWRHSDSRGAVG